MKFPVVSLFWQLYVGICLAILMVVGLFSGLYEYLQYATHVEDFYRDIRPVGEYVQRLPKEQRTPHMLKALGDEMGFEVKIITTEVFEDTEHELEWSARKNSTDIYQHHEFGLMVGIWPMTDQPGKLLQVSDLNPDIDDLAEHFQQQFDYEDQEQKRTELVTKLAIVSILLGIGGLLLYLVQRISRYLKHFGHICRDWGQGKLHLRANETAPQPIGELARQLNHMAETLERSEQEKAVIMHGVSHELRTPLSALNLAMGLLVRQYPELEQESLLQNMQQYSDQMETLVNQSLTLAKASYSNPVHSESIDLSRLLQERCEELHQLHIAKQLEFSPTDSCRVEGNSFDLQIALDNLLTNGLKYSKSQVRVQLKKTATTLDVTVEDDGPGVPIEERETLFMPFSRADESRHRDAGGFGLGLAITRAMVSNHRGTISLVDSELGGLKVLVQLPLTQAYKP